MLDEGDDLPTDFFAVHKNAKAVYLPEYIHVGKAGKREYAVLAADCVEEYLDDAGREVERDLVALLAARNMNASNGSTRQVEQIPKETADNVSDPTNDRARDKDQTTGGARLTIV